MHIPQVLLFLPWLVLSVSAANAQEGVRIVETSRVEGRGAATSTIHLLADRVRVESSDPDHVLIYRADMQVFYMIDPSERTYQQMTAADKERMEERLSEMRAMMEEQLNNMPPAQRAMMEEMMRSRMPGMGTAIDTGPITYRKVADARQVGRWACDRYEGFRNDEKVMEICAAGWSELGLAADDFRVFLELAGFFEALAGQIDVDMFPIGTEDAPAGGESFPGVPVSRTLFDDGSVTGSFEITEVSRGTFPPALFEVPEGYERGPSPFQVPD